MKETKIIMGMPITVEFVDQAEEKNLDEVFKFFQLIDDQFSTYKETSEICRINRGEIKESEYSEDMKTVFFLSEETKQATNGYFNIVKPDGKYDPSGLVKGWAIYNAAGILKKRGLNNFFIEAGGDIQPSGKNSEKRKWSVGIRNPFNLEEIVKAVYLDNEGIATSGSYIRGAHIYNPYDYKMNISDIVSLTVIGPNVYEADRFATAVFAMGKRGIDFIENLNGFEGYMIDDKGIATLTSGFARFTRE